MATKQVKVAAAVAVAEVVTASVAQTPKTNTEQEPGAAPVVSQNKTLFIKVDTYDMKGQLIGNRIVDIYHFGTKNWMSGHNWWAMHNGHTVEVTPASQLEIDNHMAAQLNALADKFNKAA